MVDRGEPADDLNTPALHQAAFNGRQAFGGDLARVAHFEHRLVVLGEHPQPEPSSLFREKAGRIAEQVVHHPLQADAGAEDWAGAMYFRGSDVDAVEPLLLDHRLVQGVPAAGDLAQVKGFGPLFPQAGEGEVLQASGLTVDHLGVPDELLPYLRQVWMFQCLP